MVTQDHFVCLSGFSIASSIQPGAPRDPPSELFHEANVIPGQLKVEDAVLDSSIVGKTASCWRLVVADS